MQKEWTTSAVKDLRDAGFTKQREGERKCLGTHTSVVQNDALCLSLSIHEIGVDVFTNIHIKQKLS